jgi:hypothetical protein
MGQVSGTYTKYDAKGLREDLSDVIYNISPTEVPFMSGAGREKVSNTLFEWQVDSLTDAVSDNRQIEGDDAAFSTPAATLRAGNYQNISRKTLILSGTLEAVHKAGRKSELAFQMAKRGQELKRDMEKASLENIAGDAGTTAGARATAGLPAWIFTNDDVGTSGANDYAGSGVPSAARTDGTQRAFTETILKAVAQSVWVAGGSLDVVMAGPVNRSKISANMTGIATRNFDISNAPAKPTASIASVDVYVTDWGVLRIVPNRFQRERDVFFIDFDYVSFAYLRPFKVEKLAKSGDAEKRQLIVEWGLKVKNEAALGFAADLTTT